MLIPPWTDCRVVVLLWIVCQHAFHRKGRQIPPARWKEANKKSEKPKRSCEPSKLKATVQGPRGAVITVFVMMDGRCVWIKKRGNNFETTHWTGIYPVSVFAR
eukprot:scaffold132595_cov31-Attheya_sp.AAC.1